MAELANRALGRVSGAFIMQLSALSEAAESASRHGLGELMFLVSETLRVISSDTRGAPLRLDEFLRQRELAADEMAEQVNGLMGTEDAATLSRQLSPLVSDVAAMLAQPGLPNTVATSLGTVRLIDYLRANIVLLVDLAISQLGSAQPMALAEAVRSLAGVLPERYPGRSVEVRVPPHVAVQIGFGDGPAHTRGTPPNVVEMNVDTFWQLATAKQSWRRAADSGALQFSGAQAAEAERIFPIYWTR